MAQRLFILGPGTLGKNLALWSLQHGFEVHLVGRTLDHAAEACDLVRRKTETLPIHVGVDWDHLCPLGRHQLCPGPEDILYEALPEDPCLKQTTWRNLERDVPESTLLLTGTSCLPLPQLASGMANPDRLMAFHLFIPIHASRLVEFAASPSTPDTWKGRATAFASQLELDLVEVKGNLGLAASRMGLAVGLEAMRLLEAGVASAASIDRLMVRGYGHPIGPLALSDRVGLDIRLAIADHLFHTTGAPAFEPPPILRNLVEQGALGRKSGRGFFSWPSPDPKDTP